MDTKLLSTDRPIKIYYALVSNVSDYSTVGESGCSVSLTGDWKEINTTLGSIKLEEKPTRAAGGLYYENTIEAIVPGHDTDTPGLNNQLNGRKVLFRVDYKSGIKKIVGNKEYNPRFFINQSSTDRTLRVLEIAFKNACTNRHLIEPEGEGV